MVQYTRVGFFARVFSLDINQHSMIISMDTDVMRLST